MPNGPPAPAEALARWTGPAQIHAQLLRLWNQGTILAARLAGQPVFPFVLPLRRPDARSLASRFDDVRTWIRMLEEGSRSVLGYGYDIVWIDINHRQIGRNRLPSGISVPSEADALHLIDRTSEAERFQALAAATKAMIPALTEWLAAKPLVALENAEDWQRILAVLDWFGRHPRPGLYLRQLDIPGVDTKFIETRKGLLSELLDLVLPAEAIKQTAAGAREFQRRYGLQAKPALVRFRILDERLRPLGLSDLSVPAGEFAGLSLPVRRVFITENEINGLAFPDIPDSLVVFGLGYGVDALAEARWLKDAEVYYWGDIDTHGFAILDRLRAFIPRARSLLMDGETLLRLRPLWVEEPAPHEGRLSRLNDEEQAVFQDLQMDQLGYRVRLEQERIPFGLVRQALDAIS